MTTNEENISVVAPIAIIVLLSIALVAISPLGGMIQTSGLLQTSGVGSGGYYQGVTLTITSNPPEAGCTIPSAGTYIYDYGDSASVTAYANSGYVFAGWYLDGNNYGTWNPIDVSMTGSHTLNAVFIPQQPQLTINIHPETGGTTNPGAGTVVYSYGQEVTITEQPSTGYIFNGWYLDGVYQGTTTTLSFTMQSNRVVDAFFSPTLQSSHAVATADLVVRGANNVIYYRTYTPIIDEWSDWTALPGSTCDTPAAAIINNELHMVVRGLDGNTLWHGYLNLNDKTFSGWTLLGGSTPSAPTLTSDGTTLALIVRGNNGFIYYRSYSVTARAWTVWTAFSTGTTGDSVAATILSNKLHIVVRSNDGFSLWHNSIDLSTQATSGWQPIDGATQTKPILTTCKALNEICLIVRGANGEIYQNTLTGSTWNGWTPIAGGTTNLSPAATIIDETLHLVVTNPDGSSLLYSSIDLVTASHTSWRPIGGSTPSTPTLTG